MISKTCEYGLAAMICLAAETRRSLTAHEIAESTGMPEGYLAKVLRKLATKGLVRSRRGPAGGFALSRPADQIELIEIIRAVEPKHSRPDLDAEVLAPLRERIERASEAELGCFAGVTLADVTRAGRESAA